MTCIVAIVEKDKIWMGCDRLSSYGDGAMLIDTKIVKKENIIMGFAGNVRDINIIRFEFKVPKQDEKISDYEYIAITFTNAIRKLLKKRGAARIRDSEESGNAYILIGYNKKLYYMSGDFSIVRIEEYDFYATGSGINLAIGSLYSTSETELTPEERIEKALESAEKFTRSVRGPFVIECLE